MQLYKLAKELGMDSNELTKILDEQGMDTKEMRPFSKLDDGVVEEVKKLIKIPKGDGVTTSDIPTPELKEIKPENIPIKKKATTPWKPARVLDIPKHLKDPAFVYRWVDKDKPGNVRKKLSEGWEIDKELTKKMTGVRTATDGSNIDGTMQIREMIVMKIPKELAEARNKYFSERTKDNLEAEQNKFRGKTEGHSYGEIKEG